MLKEVVKEAGEILKEGYFKNKRVSFKSDVDLVTEYDIKIENFLKERLAPLSLPFIAEESFEGELPKSGIFIDPIDGTTNFVHNIAYTSISVAIYEEGKGVEGVVYNPILNELFYAKRGVGAYLNDKKIEVSGTLRLIDALLATGFPYTKVDMQGDFIFAIESLKNVLPKSRDVRRLGSAAIDLCYVACGRFGGFFEINLKPWDVAAGILIVEEAGGKISNHLGDEYSFGDIIVATNGKIHEELISNLKWYEAN